MARDHRPHGRNAPAAEQHGRHGRFGPRGGLAGASDDFGFYLDADEDATDWRGHGEPPANRDLFRYTATAAPDDFPAPAEGHAGELEDWQEAGLAGGPDRSRGPDPHFGGRDNAAWYARHGSNADRMQRARAASAAVARGRHRGHAPQGYRRSDQRLGEVIHARLTEARDVDARGIRVDCADGRVRLEGEVPSRRMKHRAEDIVAGCHGVEEVDNRLQVAPRRHG